jgi:hypothetical protein
MSNPVCAGCGGGFTATAPGPYVGQGHPHVAGYSDDYHQEGCEAGGLDGGVAPLDCICAARVEIVAVEAHQPAPAGGE